MNLGGTHQPMTLGMEVLSTTWCLGAGQTSGSSRPLQAAELPLKLSLGIFLPLLSQHVRVCMRACACVYACMCILCAPSALSPPSDHETLWWQGPHLG